MMADHWGSTCSLAVCAVGAGLKWLQSRRSQAHAAAAYADDPPIKPLGYKILEILPPGALVTACMRRLKWRVQGFVSELVSESSGEARSPAHAQSIDVRKCKLQNP